MNMSYKSMLTPAGIALVPVQPLIPDQTVYEIVNGNDLTPHYGHRPSFTTVAEAVAAGGGPFNYVVAVVNGWMRELNAEEEAEFQKVRRP